MTTLADLLTEYATTYAAPGLVADTAVRRAFMAGALAALTSKTPREQLIAECVQFGRAIGTKAEAGRRLNQPTTPRTHPMQFELTTPTLAQFDQRDPAHRSPRRQPRLRDQPRHQDHRPEHHARQYRPGAARDALQCRGGPGLAARHRRGHADAASEHRRNGDASRSRSKDGLCTSITASTRATR